MKRTVIVLFLGLSFFATTSAQSQVDSLRSTYTSTVVDSVRLDLANELSRAYAFLNPDSARFFGLLAISLANELQDENALANAKLNTAVSHHVKGQFDAAISYYLEVYAHRTLVDDSTGISAVLNNLGAAYASTGNYPKSLDALQKSLEIKLALNQLDRSATTLANIGNIYFDQKSFDKALSYYLRSKEICDELGITSGSFRANNNMGLTFLELDKSDSALHYYRESEQLFDDTNPCEKTFMLDGLSQVYLDKNDFQKAKTYALELLAVSTNCGDPEKETSALTMLGRIALKQGKQAEGLNLLEQAAVKALTIDQKQNIVDVANLLYQQYKSSGDYASAMNYLEIYTRENEALNDAALTKELTRVEMQYEFDQELDSIAYEQRIAETIYQQELTKKQNSLYLTLGVLLLVAIIASVLYLYYHKKALLNRQLMAQNEQIRKAFEEREVLMREIHHRVKNNLQVVSSLLNIQSKVTPHEDAKVALIESRNRVLTMALVHQKLYRSEDLTDIKLEDYIEEIASSVVSSHQVERKAIDLEISVEEIKLELDQIINIGLIVNELVTNSLKHAFLNSTTGTVAITIKVKEAHLMLEVADDGENRSQKDLPFSYGQRLIQSLVAGMDGELAMDKTNGTRTSINLPLA